MCSGILSLGCPWFLVLILPSKPSQLVLKLISTLLASLTLTHMVTSSNLVSLIWASNIDVRNMLASVVKRVGDVKESLRDSLTNTGFHMFLAHQ